MISAIRLYQYIAPLILTPASWYLWWHEYDNLQQTLAAWLTPILWAYIVPAVGTNVCQVWEFDVRWKKALSFRLRMVAVAMAIQGLSVMSLKMAQF